MKDILSVRSSVVKEQIKNMKLISWNVNGLRACMQKGFMDFFNEIDADIFCLQETKMQQGQLELELPGYYQYWNSAEKKGYSGTAMFTKKEPLAVTYGIGIEEHSTLTFSSEFTSTCANNASVFSSSVASAVSAAS